VKSLVGARCCATDSYCEFCHLFLRCALFNFSRNNVVIELAICRYCLRSALHSAAPVKTKKKGKAA
jgi:hypothetical protein